MATERQTACVSAAESNLPITKTENVEEQLRQLESGDIPPDDYTTQNFTDLLAKHPEFLKIIKNLNIKDWEIKNTFDDKDDNKHSKYEDTCKECGFSKCRLGRFNRNDFEVLIKFKINPLFVQCAGYGSTNWSYHTTMDTKKIKKDKTLLFSFEKYKNSPFYIRWYYDVLALLCVQYSMTPSNTILQYILQYKNSELPFLYLKDVDEVGSVDGETIICQTEIYIEETECIRTAKFKYSEFLQMEDKLFIHLKAYRIAP